MSEELREETNARYFVRNRNKIVLFPVPALWADVKKAWLRSQLENAVDGVFGRVLVGLVDHE
ncbi:hypothetical protein LCGC14_2710240 [marine sediment metagenome]|uniref:Uncharacterized protein n=1 Tax=marine sediment metagenome TaxID=412755 RepID=A0A0F9C4U6_9ZZZZ